MEGHDAQSLAETIRESGESIRALADNRQHDEPSALRYWNAITRAGVAIVAAVRGGYLTWPDGITDVVAWHESDGREPHPLELPTDGQARFVPATEAILTDVASLAAKAKPLLFAGGVVRDANTLAANETLLLHMIEHDRQCLARVCEELASRIEAVAKPDKTNGEQRKKKGTTPGDARDAAESALLAHHEYSPGRVKRWTAIDRAAVVKITSKGYPTGFFKRHFGSYRQYKAICNKQAPKLEQVLRGLHDSQRTRGLGRTRDAAEALAERDE
ncbi:MAG: hypothetical protein K8T91_25620 [Planctomycetes bacterium]|nr:hypothetical protein [Planctomycetota bacterium]